jgi:hypothetical protein
MEVLAQYATWKDTSWYDIGRNRMIVRLGLLLAILTGWLISADPAFAEEQAGKRVIGATAIVQEIESDLCFVARVDTGATTSSLHVEEWEIAEAADSMAHNVGRPIRFLVKNQDGESAWLEREIAAHGVVKTSEEAEHRYKVYLTLNCNDVKKKVLVSLNDRSHMKYPVLLGRNYLEGDFLVDVEMSNSPDN